MEGKGKGHPITCHWGGWLTPRRAATTLFAGKDPVPMGPRNGLYGYGEARHTSGFELPNRPVSSESLYQLRYSGPLTHWNRSLFNNTHSLRLHSIECLIWRRIPAFVCRNRGKPWITSVTAVGVPSEIWTGHYLPTRSQKVTAWACVLEGANLTSFLELLLQSQRYVTKLTPWN